MAAVAAQAAAPQPDILLFMPDQFRGDCLGIAGHPVVRTPHLDQLAREGVRFRGAWSTCPSCIPARHALLTGQHPATSGVVGFAGRPILTPTLPQLLAAAGYQTMLCGRYMHQEPTADNYGYDREIRGSTYVPDDDYDHYLKREAPATGGIVELVRQLGLSMNGWAAKPWPLDEALHPTAWTGREAALALRDTPTDRPLFLTASFYSPHSPLFPPRRLFEAYAAMTLPPPAHGDWVHWDALSPEGDRTGHRVRLEGATLHATQAGYFGLVEQIDEQFAALRSALRERAARSHRPWIVVFTSDHGELLGDHGYYRKCEPYEGSAHIPMLIAGSPDLHLAAGRTVDQPVGLEDILPTLLEFAGAPPRPGLDGVSLAPALRGQPFQSRHWLAFEHAPCYSQEQSFQALTDGRVKYIWRPLNGTEQFFDLEKDPREEHDLAADPASRTRVEEGRAELIRRLAGRPEGFSDGAKLIPGRPYPPLQARPPRPAADPGVTPKS